MQEIYKNCITQKTAKRAGKMYLMATEKKALMEATSDAGLILFEYMLSKGGNNQQLYVNANMARALGWTEDKVKRVKSSLKKAGWFKQDTHTHRGTQIVRYYLGPDQVSSSIQDLHSQEEALSTSVESEIVVAEVLARLKRDNASGSVDNNEAEQPPAKLWGEGKPSTS